MKDTLESRFLAALEENRVKAQALGVRMRPVTDMRQVRAITTANRVSNGFDQLLDLGRLDLSMEALCVDKRYTALFSDDEANTVLMRLLGAGYF